MSNQTHEYHLVNPSAWPILTSIGFLILTIGAVLFFHGKTGGDYTVIAGFAACIYCGYGWWRDIVRESRVDNAHTSPVKLGLRVGMALFILSEVMFFFAFFFSYFKSAIFPVGELQGYWVIAEGVFPPKDIVTFDPFDLPFLNTLILLLSGTAVTWAHHALLEKDRKGLVNGLAAAVFLGVIFSVLQAYEYGHAAFDMDTNNYSANFYLATGFHGAHVIIGTIFLGVCLVRARRGHFDDKNHLGFEFAAWYWHFVDVVWLFLFVFVYIWGQ